MRYETKKCPHCGFTYKFNEPKDTDLYGSPIRVCIVCGNSYIDRDYREMAVDGIRLETRGFISWRLLIYCVVSIGFGIPALISCFNMFDLGMLIMGGMFSLIGLYLLIASIIDYPARKKWIKKEFEASDERLRNRDYALKLASLGYNVPAKYLVVNDNNDL